MKRNHLMENMTKEKETILMLMLIIEEGIDCTEVL